MQTLKCFFQKSFWEKEIGWSDLLRIFQVYLHHKLINDSGDSSFPLSTCGKYRARWQKLRNIIFGIHCCFVGCKKESLQQEHKQQHTFSLFTLDTVENWWICKEPVTSCPWQLSISCYTTSPGSQTLNASHIEFACSSSKVPYCLLLPECPRSPGKASTHPHQTHSFFTCLTSLYIYFSLREDFIDAPEPG